MKQTLLNLMGNLDSARNVSYMTDREKEMVKEINTVRFNPKGYVPMIAAYVKKKEASLANITMGAEWVKEEIETAKELIAELNKTASLPLLKPHEGIFKATKIHGEEGKAKGSLGHQGANGSWPWDRIGKIAPEITGSGENLVGGPDNVRDSVIALLIDSGIPNRGHRKNLLNPTWEFVACYEVGKVGQMPNYWVQSFGKSGNNTAATTTTTTTTTTTVVSGGGSAKKAAPALLSGTLDTARGVNYMTEREKDMIKEINLIRSNPVGYISVIEDYIKKQEASKANMISGMNSVNEEIRTARELITELKKTPKLSMVKPHKGVYKAAKLHGNEGKAKGDLGHQGSDGSWPWDRVLRQAPDLSDGNENLVGGPVDVRTSVILLLVDSGIPNRGHRKTLLNPKWRYSGCYEVGKVGQMPNYWVQKFGG